MDLMLVHYDGTHGPQVRVPLRGGQLGLQAQAGRAYGLPTQDANDLLRLGTGWQRCQVLTAAELKKVRKAGANLAPLGHATLGLEAGEMVLVGAAPTSTDEGGAA